MLIYDDIRFKLNNMKPRLSDLRQALDLDKGQEEIAALEKQSAEPGFWDDPANSQKVLQRIKQLKDKAAHYAALTTMYEDVVTTIEMAEEMEDESLFPEVQEGFKRTEAELERQTLTTLLSGEYDANNAILSFHAGAGGTEAMDWTQMLVRMYQHWADAKGFKWKMLDELDGEDAGLKSAEMLIEGENAYGYLKSENGVHRLVRVSPFDASGRRQTSFAALEVMPEMPDDVDIDIRPEDLKVDTYRSSGAGGQHVNKTESAIRITHLPTGVVVECQDERSQYKNKDRAMKLLRSRLYQRQKEAQEAQRAGLRRDQVGSGDRSGRIRTYNFPQGRLTDHRIGFTSYKLEQIMNGELDEVVDALAAADEAARLRGEGETEQR